MQVVGRLHLRTLLPYSGCISSCRLWGFLSDTVMHRVTARFVLVLLLVGLFAPVALAISAPAPHACCLRKPMHDRSCHNSEFNASPGCCQRDCCRPLTVSQWAHLTPPASAQRTSASTTLQSERRPIHVATPVNDAHSGRAPPQFSIT